jgi:hypothetical protein
MWPAGLLDLFTCARDSCDAECRPGRHWECACQYSAPGGYFGRALDIKLSLRYFGGVNPVAKVRACGKTSIGCNPSLDTVEGAQGVVTLTVPGESQGFSGAFLITDTDPDASTATQADAGKSQIIPTRVVHSLPFTPRVTHFVGAGVRNIVEAYANLGGLAYDPSSASAEVYLTDCQYAGAIGATIEATGSDESSRVIYLRGGIPDLQADRTDVDGAWVGFLPAPFASEFVVRGEKGGNVVGSIRTRTEPDAVTLAVVYPFTKGSPECSP